MLSLRVRTLAAHLGLHGHLHLAHGELHHVHHGRLHLCAWGPLSHVVWTLHHRQLRLVEVHLLLQVNQHHLVVKHHLLLRHLVDLGLLTLS